MRKFIYILFLLLTLTELSGQLNIVGANVEPYSPENLIRNVFLGSGVQVTSINYEGDDSAVGYFSEGIGEINLSRGIIMSTGNVESANSINTTTDDNGEIFSGQSDQDPDLQSIANEVIDDVSLYTITFIPSSDTLRFSYVFASEEYPEYICEINDVFGFFVSGPDPEGGFYNAKNIALIPEPSDPSGTTFTNIPVSINTIHANGGSACPAEYDEYYNEVPVGTENFQLNAYLDVFIAEIVVIPCEEYTIKLGVADAGDDLLNSVVFLEAKSFGTGTLTLSLNSLSVDGSLAEGCGGGSLVFGLPQTVNEDYIIDIDFLNPGNAATPGDDYPEIPSQLVIPAGSKSISIPLEAYSDGISEGDEIIAFEIQVDQCNRKTFEITIRDDELYVPLLPDDVTICDGESFLIDSDLDPNFNLPPSPYFENLTSIDITPELEPVYSDIQVSGVIPTLLSPNLIEQVCIKGLSHRDLTDLDIYLISPGGQFLELSTDNGFKTNNFADVDSFINTCFSPFAINNINNGNNLAGPIFDANETYTGDFKPEGVWSDLWDGDYPTNGTWRLLLVDDTNGAVGKLDGWSISFRSFYNLTYEWSSDPNSTICENCEDINVTPLSDTEYTLKIIDSYGCERSESIMVSVAPGIDKPSINCNSSTQNSIELLWNEVANATGYEIRINGEEWITTSDLNYSFTSLASSSDFTIEIMALSDDCNSGISSVMCSTDNCSQPGVIVSLDSEVSCPGGNDGMLTMMATGSGPFVFKMGEFTNNTGVFSDVRIGVNNFSVTDNTGCTTSGDFNMPGPDNFELNPGYKLTESCNVVSDINGSVNITGGTLPYSFLWSNASIDQVAENLSPGTYYVTITDAMNCEITDSLTIPMLEQFVFSVVTEPPLCKDGKNGKATISVTTGNGPFIFLWEDGSTEQSNSNLEEGFYVVTVTDGLGCVSPSPFTIGEGAILDLDIIPENITCLGMDDGKAVAIATGGKSPYTFHWDGVESSDNSVIDLVKGEHELVVTDDNNCTATIVFNILEPDGMTFLQEQQNNLCFSDETGDISISNVSSPNGNVVISWDDGGFGFNRNGLANGTYCFTLNDATACELSECVEIISPEEILVSEEITGLTCLGLADGKIKLNVSGGIGTYDYNWSGPDGLFNSESVAQDLKAGEYFITISDENECDKVVSYEVVQATEIEVDFTVFPVSCFGESTGQIFFAATGGLPPFTYEWIGPENFVATTNNITDVPAGNYFVTYIDNAGCSETFDFFIAQPTQPFLANISLPDTICFGTKNGKLEVVPTGGTGPYTVEWSNGVASTLNTSLSPGDYSVTITDSRTCTIIASSSISENEEISILLEDSPSSCYLTNDGSARITEIFYGNNAVAFNSFVFQWNTIPMQSETEATNLIGGNNYVVTATDKFGCSGQEIITISSPEPVLAGILEISHVTCFGKNDGFLDIIGSGGTSPYNYQWDGQTNFSTNKKIEMLPRGNYKVTITDSNGCQGFNSFAIEEPGTLNMDFRVIDVNCFGGSSGRAEALVKGGTAPYSYIWSNNATGKEIENVISEQYNVTVTDVNGCNLTDSTRVNEPDKSIQVSLEVDDVSCNGGNNGRIEISADGGSGFYRYSLDGVEYSSSNRYSNLDAGNYSIYVSDFKGCVDSFLEVQILQPEAVIVDLGPDIIIPFGDNVELSPSVFNHFGDISFQWQSSNLDLLSCEICSNPLFNGEREASFELLVVDENGCSGRDFISIRLENYSPFFVPTAFTPNGDSVNDNLIVFSDGISKIKTFQIFDRWGELVYSVKGIDSLVEEVSWNGVYKGEILPSGLYYWFADVTYQNGFEETLNGNTTILK